MGAQNGFGGNTESFALCAYSKEKKEYKLDAYTKSDDIGTLNKAKTRAQIKQDLASMNGTINLTGKFNQKGVVTSVQQQVIRDLHIEKLEYQRINKEFAEDMAKLRKELENIKVKKRWLWRKG